MPRVNRVCEPDRAQLLHTFSHVSEGIIPEFWIRLGTNCGPLEHPLVRERFFEYFDRVVAYFRGIDLVDYAIQPNHIHLAILTNPAPIPLEEVAQIHAELRDEVLNPKDPCDRKRLVKTEEDMHNCSLLMRQVTGPFGQWFMRDLESKRDARIHCRPWSDRFGCTHLLSAKAAVQGTACTGMNPAGSFAGSWRPSDRSPNPCCGSTDGRKRPGSPCDRADSALLSDLRKAGSKASRQLFSTGSQNGLQCRLLGVRTPVFRTENARFASISALPTCRAG
jgi:hypothetical protein